MKVDGLPAEIEDAVRSFLDELTSILQESLDTLAPPNSIADLKDLLDHNRQVLDVAGEWQHLLIAYAHAVASPRPRLLPLAQAQGVSLSSFTRRYSDLHLKGVLSLLSASPDDEVIRRAFPSLGAAADVVTAAVTFEDSLLRSDEYGQLEGPNRAGEVA